MPCRFLSSLLHRTRAAILMLLVVVLPLQSVAQLAAGVQGHRHVHAAALLTELIQPLRSVLDRLHAAQEARLAGVGRQAADGWHEHGGLLHRHGRDAPDAVDVGDAGNEGQQAGATAFIAWLPAVLSWPVEPVRVPPAAPTVGWGDRAVAPPLAPPRG